MRHHQPNSNYLKVFLIHKLLVRALQSRSVLNLVNREWKREILDEQQRASVCTHPDY
ncbi:MAG: hypothetical protein OXD01_15595 [Gammaproteobacteria bacterium]|nr:hypothetical protein [Gammaproteobacteria bacterium]